MSDINKLIQNWLPADEELKPFYKGMDELLGELLPNNDQVLDVDNNPAKIIADPLLGYIYITPLEVAIIDTRLYQRLRGISQLGLAYLVFPSLGYSRFEHSLGVLGRLNQMLQKLQENYARVNAKSDFQEIVNEYLVSLRLAALLHDVGHCLFSHCSERVINNLTGDSGYPSSETIREKFSDKFKKDKLIPFAEIFSVTIIGSKRFYDFINKLGAFKLKEIPIVLERTARFILGLPIDNNPDSIFMYQLITSGIDADKIDYMVREQHYSGIKLEIDLDRIFSKINVFNLNANQLPKNLEHLKKQFPADTKYKVLGFSKGGQFVFEEFCIARLALHVKIYLHQKVRAAESQLANYLKDISNNEGDKIRNKELQKAHNWFRLSESIIEVPELIDKEFGEAEGLFFGGFISEKQKSSLRLLYERSIYLRAYAFGQINSFSEHINVSDISSQELEDFFQQFDEKKIKKEIVDEAIRIYSINHFDLTDNDIERLDTIIVDIPHLRFKSVQQGQESIHFDRPPLAPLKWTIPLDKIVVYFEENRALGYVFSPSKLAPIINIAAEKVFFETTNKVFNQEGNISQHTLENAKVIKTALTENDYYKKYPELREVSAYLNRADAADEIKAVYNNLLNFSSLKNERITVNKIITFVNQFPISLQEACLMFLKHLKVYDEKLLGEKLQAVIASLPNKENVGIAYLGSATDSSARIAYHIREEVESLYDLKIRELNESLILSCDRLILYDDNINSGLQLLNIFAELLGKKNQLEELALEESHLNEFLNEDAKQKLLQIEIHICYTIGVEGSAKKAIDLLESKLGFEKNNLNIHVKETLKLDDRIFAGPNSSFQNAKKLELKAFISDISKQLLVNDGKDEQKANSRLLGYANAESMVLFPYNIPTMTITPIWFKGELDDGIPWVPLAERRRRSKGGNYISED